MNKNGKVAAPGALPGLGCWLQMIRTYDYLHAQVAQLLQKHGLSVPQFEMLSTLAESDCDNQQELADRLRVTKGNLVGLIDRLAEKGWVERAQVPGDRRVNRVRITEAGRKWVRKAVPEQAAIVAAMMSRLNDKERVQLHGLLQKLEGRT